MPTTYADLERMYDGPIPREELARCEDLRPKAAEQKEPRYTLSDSGRLLLRGADYDPMVDAIDADRAFMQRIADLLNQYGEG